MHRWFGREKLMRAVCRWAGHSFINKEEQTFVIRCDLRVKESFYWRLKSNNGPFHL